MEALQQPIQSCILLPLLRCFSIALLHNVQLLGLGDICSSPPAKSPHNMVLFMCILLLYPSNVIKKSETHHLCLNDNRRNTITGNTFTTKTAQSQQWFLLLHANKQGRMTLLQHPSQERFNVFIASQPSQLRMIVLCFIFNLEKVAISCIRQQILLEFVWQRIWASG